MAFGLGKMKIQAVNNVNNVNESDSRSCTFINGRICFQNNANELRLENNDRGQRARVEPLPHRCP